MRKILASLIGCFLFVCCFTLTASAEINYKSGNINDSTTIESDFKYLNLDYSDYVLSNDSKGDIYDAYHKNKNEEQFVVAVAESREDKIIITYIYVYNILFNLSGYSLNIKLDVKFNDASVKTYTYSTTQKDMELVQQAKRDGLMKFKIQYYKTTDLTRKYNIRINNGPDEEFECTYTTTINQSEQMVCDEFKFNSFIYITSDEVVPVVLKESKNVLPGIVGQSLSILLGNNPYQNVVVYFYNFSSNKKIDRIISANMKWNQHMEQATYRYPVEVPLQPLLGPLFLFTDWTLHFGDLIENKKVYDEKSCKEFITQGEKEYTFLGKKLKMNAFRTPASDRIKELGNYGNSMTDSDKTHFTKYQHSIMFTAGEWVDGRPISSGSGVMKTLMVEQVSLVSLNYTTAGKYYTSFVADPDGPDDPEDPYNPIDPTKASEDSWFIQMLVDMGRATVEFLEIKNVSRGWMIGIGAGELVLLFIVAIVVIVLFLKFILIPLIKLLLK